MLLMKDIIREGHATLTKVASNVVLPLSDMDKKILKKMNQFLINSQDEKMSQEYDLRPGVGIAAPQLNIAKRMFALYAEDLDQILHSMCIINPLVTEKSDEFTYLPGGEGCLSIDRETTGLTPRHKSITFTAYLYDIPSNQTYHIEMKLEGYLAIVFQHEFDHLNGVLYISKLFDELPYAQPLFEIDK